MGESQATPLYGSRQLTLKCLIYIALLVYFSALSRNSDYNEIMIFIYYVSHYSI